MLANHARLNLIPTKQQTEAYFVAVMLKPLALGNFQVLGYPVPPGHGAPWQLWLQVTTSGSVQSSSIEQQLHCAAGCALYRSSEALSQVLELPHSGC